MPGKDPLGTRPLFLPRSGGRWPKAGMGGVTIESAPFRLPAPSPSAQGKGSVGSAAAELGRGCGSDFSRDASPAKSQLLFLPPPAGEGGRRPEGGAALRSRSAPFRLPAPSPALQGKGLVGSAAAELGRDCGNDFSRDASSSNHHRRLPHLREGFGRKCQTDPSPPRRERIHRGNNTAFRIFRPGRRSDRPAQRRPAMSPPGVIAASRR